jgi:hypothetical protein
LTPPTYLDEPTVTTPFKVAVYTGLNGPAGTQISGAATAYLNDSLGDPAPLPLPNEYNPFFKNSGDITPGHNGSGDMNSRLLRYANQIVGDRGYWTVGGVPHIIYPGYVGDRLTGVPVKLWLGVELTGLSGYNLNGVYVKPANAPVVSAATLNVPIDGTPTDIDIEALTTHPDGASMRLSTSYKKPDRARLSVSDWIVTVSALDVAEAGTTDKAYLWVEDIGGSGRGQVAGGNATLVKLQITYV